MTMSGSLVSKLPLIHNEEVTFDIESRTSLSESFDKRHRRERVFSKVKAANFNEMFGAAMYQ